MEGAIEISGDNMDELEEAFTRKSQSDLLREEILVLEKELGINQLPTKEEYAQQRTRWEKFQICLRIKTEGEITRERLEHYDFISIVQRDISDGTLIVYPSGGVRRLDEHDTVIIYKQKIKHLQELKTKKNSKLLKQESKPIQEAEKEINAPAHEEFQFFKNK